MRRRAGVSGLSLLSLLPLSLLAVACSGRPTPGPSPHAASGGLDAAASPAVTAEISDEALCALPSNGRISLDGARPFSPSDPHCPAEDAFCDTVDAPPDPKDTCFVANQNIARAERESVAPSPSAKAAAWDGASKPLYLDRIDAHVHLTTEEHARLRANGFVVLDRLAYVDYASAFHDVFQEQLPLYVGVDPIFHAVFRGTELVLERIEKQKLKPALLSLIMKLRTGLRASKGIYDRDIREDLDVYLGTALGLASPESRDKPGLSLFGHEEAIHNLIDLSFHEGRPALDDQGQRGSERGLVTVAMFGRERVVDFSQLDPRGHYAARAYPTDEGLQSYFRAIMWLSRLEFNLVSRSCRSSQPGIVPNPEETPREAKDALALAQIAEKSGALAELRMFEEVYSNFAGRREDVSMVDLLRLARDGDVRVSDPELQPKLKARIGAGFHRSARIHYMPEGAEELPVITTLLGPRIAPDIAPLTRLVHDRTPGRLDLGAADVGFVLGHDRARRFLSKDLAKFPGLERELAAAREETARGSMGKDVYASWLRAMLALSAPLRGAVPSFLGREAYQDYRMNSALVGYGQLRHAFVLLAAQGYDAYGCEIPDGYVEPLLPVWDALLAHVRNVRRVAKGFDGLERVIAMLRAVVATEISGAPLSDAQRRWLGMVSEHVPNGGYSDTGEPPKWTGWYFDMFEDRERGASRTSAFVADYFTLTYAGKVKYLGANGPRLGIFIVDTGGAPRAMVGPVATGYETETPLADAIRLSDETALEHTPKSALWRESFAVAPRPEPEIGLEGRVLSCSGDAGPPERRVALRASRPVGKVSVTLLDHHADPLGAPVTLEVNGAWSVATFGLPASFNSSRFGVEALHVRVHDLNVAGLGSGPYDYFTSPSVFQWNEGSPSERLPRRPQGAGDFAVGRRPDRAKDEAARLAAPEQGVIRQDAQQGSPAVDARRDGGADAGGGGAQPPCRCVPGEPLCSCF